MHKAILQTSLKLYPFLKRIEEALPIWLEKILDNLRAKISYSIWNIFSPYKKNIDFSKIKRVIVLNDKAVGDNLIRTPTMEAIARTYGRVDVIVPNDKAIRIFEGNPFVKDIYSIDKIQPEDLKKYQLAVVINYGKKFMDLINKSKIDFSIGLPYSNPIKIFKMNKVLSPQLDLNQMDNMLRLSTAVGAKLPSKIQTRFFLKPEDKTGARKYLKSKKISKFIIINPAASSFNVKYSSRWWPNEYWAEVINAITKKYPKISVIVNGGSKQEAENYELIYNQILSKNQVHYFDGELGVFAALIGQAIVIVQPNTGSGHLAAALGTPVITLIGFTDKAWAPWSKKSIPLYHPEVCTNCNNTYCKKKNRECMMAIKPEEVIKAIEKFVR